MTEHSNGNEAGGGPPGGGVPGGPEGGPSGRFARARTAFGPGGWVRRFARLWGFLGFALLVIILARHVLLPFIFALVLVFILAPIVKRMSLRADGSKRMPMGLSIISCYLVLIAFIVGFVVILAPRLSHDAARIGREAPRLYKKLNKEWAPKAGAWLDKQLPSLAPPPPVVEELPTVPDVPLPPRTSLVLTPLPDGRYAVQLQPAGVSVSAEPGGGYTITPNQRRRAPERTEDKIRAWANKALISLQSQLDDFFRFGQALVGAAVRTVFTFFLVLMIAAFILLDLKKIHEFVRSLVPAGFRDDYDAIVIGINRGLSGVIRGQLLICLVNGILTYIGLLIFGVKYSLILAVVAAVLSLIPIFGSILSTIPIVLAALVSGDEGVDVARALFATGWIILIHFIEGNFLNPKIIGTAAKIHPVLVIFALIVGEASYGLVGALLAVPVASIVQVIFLHVRHKAWKPDATGPVAT